MTWASQDSHDLNFSNRPVRTRMPGGVAGARLIAAPYADQIPRFAVAAAGHWWCDEGCRRYRQTHRLLILADAGGSNSCRSRVWKAQLQEQLCDRSGLDVTVCHYLTGCSKWNPIEHRLFSHISLNWAAVPLRSFETVTRYIEGTQTATGLQVKAVLKRGGNGLPAWNYTLHPRHDYSKNNQVIC